MRRRLVLAGALVGLLRGVKAAHARGGGGHSSGGRPNGSSRSSGARGGDHTVRGYTTRKGTHVMPHHATNPDATSRDNYSTKGNVNPYTGKPGTKSS